MEENRKKKGGVEKAFTQDRRSYQRLLKKFQKKKLQGEDARGGYVY